MRSLSLLLALLVASATFAQSAPNYDCEHAIALPVAASNIQDSFGVMDGAELPVLSLVPPPGCGSTNNARHGWFSFVATASSLWLRSDANVWNARVEVFSGSCGSLTSIACANAGDAPLALTGLSVGSTYYFRQIYAASMDLTSVDALGAVAVVSSPTNDECANARLLTPVNGAAPLQPGLETSTLGATQSQSGCSAAAASNDDVWYRFTATSSTHWLKARYQDATTLTTEWMSGTCGSLTNMVCGNEKATGLTPGQQYYIRQYTTSTDAAVTTRAYVALYAPAPNDECANAIPMEVAQGTDAPMPKDMSSVNATASTVPCSDTGNDVWFSFVAPTTTVIAYTQAGESTALFSGSCGSLTCVFDAQTAQTRTFTGLTAGTIYYLKAGSSSGPQENVLYLFAPPNNDECVDAEELTVQASVSPSSYTYGHTIGATQSIPACSGGGADDDIWYRFTATDSVQLVYLRALFTTDLYFSMKVELLGGTCDALTSLACLPPVFGLNNYARLNNLTAGTAYYLRVHTTNTGDAKPIRIAVTRGIVNDEACGAIALSSATLDQFDLGTPTFSNNASNGTVGCAWVKDLWYRFTATGTSAGFLAQLGSFDAELLNGPCESLTSVMCRTNVDRAQFTGLTPGQEYHVRLSKGVGGPFFPMYFGAPANDEITGAISLPTNASTFAMDAHEAWTYGATQSISRLCGTQGTPDDDVWFSFVATQAAHTIGVSDRNMHYTATPLSAGFRIEAYDPITLDSMGLADGVLGCGSTSVALSGLSLGHTIYFRVYSASDAADKVAAFLVSVSNGDNDEAIGAHTLTYGDDYSAVFNTSGATESQPGSNCSVTDHADDDIWFKFVANGSRARLVVGYHDQDPALELFSGTPGNLVSIACSDNILELPTNLTSGQTYYARLYSWKDNTPVSGRIGLFTSPSLTANDCVDETCLGPVLLANPGIEQGANCWPAFPQISNGDIGFGASLAPGWFDLAGATADSYSSCADHDSRNEVPHSLSIDGFELLARNGKGMAGVFVRDGNGAYMEYVDAPLTTPLTVGEAYLVSFHVATTPITGVYAAFSGLGALLTVGAGPTAGNGLAPGTAQVRSTAAITSTEWVDICGVVVADQPYDHIRIGNFQSPSEQDFIFYDAFSSSYYFIDDVVVALVTDPGCITGLGDVPPNDDAAHSATGDALRVYPNPANDRVNIVCDADLFGKRGVIEVFDVTGQRVRVEEVPFLNALQPLQLSSDWKEGLYLVMLRVEGQAPRAARVIIRH